MRSLRSKFACAFRGIYLALRDKSIFLQFVLMFVVLVGFRFFALSQLEWCVILLCCGLVIISEIANTAIEQILDVVHPEKHQQIRNIKDLSAGMVLLASMFAFVIAMLILGGKL